MDSMSNGMQVVRARPQDLDIILSILMDAQDWLRARGIAQGVVPPRERLAERIGRGETYVALLEGQPVATLALTLTGEPFWDDPSGDALYLHSFAVMRAFAGRGIGRSLLQWAEDVAAVSAGRRYLRLDIWGENRALFEYYTAAGFTHRKDDWRMGWWAALFEKAVCGAEKGRALLPDASEQTT